MNNIFTRFTLIAALVAVGSVYGCGSDSPDNGGSTGDEGGSTGTGGSKGKGGSGGSATTGTGGAKATGGAGGSAKDAAAASDTDEPASDADQPTDDSGTTDDSAVSSDVSTPDTAGTDGTPGSDAATGAILACWPDPKVIKICHQLENACENCGPKKGVACQNGKYPQVCACFDLVEKAFKGMATDADCEKFAVANACVVDDVATTGNTCGSLNCELPDCKCNTPGCEEESNRGKTCAADQHYGISSACNKWATKCSCK
jgi:hypothetical protein